MQIVTNLNNLKSRRGLFIPREFPNSSYCEIMVKFIIMKENDSEWTKFSREFNTYGVGEKLLHP